MDIIKLNTSYAGLKKFVDYPQVDEGYDYVIVKNDGKNIYVPSNLVAKGKELYYAQMKEQELENEDDEDYNDYDDWEY